jgi:hypothetical protein
MIRRVERGATNLQRSQDPYIRKFLPALAVCVFVSFWYAALLSKAVPIAARIRIPDASADTPTPTDPPIYPCTIYPTYPKICIPIRRPHLAHAIPPHHLIVRSTSLASTTLFSS